MAEGDIYEVRIEGLCNTGKRWANVFHYLLDVEAVADDLFNKSKKLAQLAFDEYEANLIPLLAEDHFLISARATRIYPDPGVPGTAGGTTAVPGGVTGESLPGDVAVVCTQRSATPGRSYLGRFYISGIPESSAELDQLITTVHSDWLDACTACGLGGYTDSDANEWDQCVFSRKFGLADPPVPPVSAEVVDVEVDITLRNMRSRGRSERVPLST